MLKRVLPLALSFVFPFFLMAHQPNVLMVHLDGMNADAFQAMRKLGQLPHFETLIKRGKFSPYMATVDKSETMKVIQSYLTSKVDQKIAGWWQFERDEFRFYNTWMGATGVIGFAIGDRYPLSPTILDFLHAKGKTLLGGFSLSRRGIPFRNYTRNYRDGLRGVYEHEYYRQMEATTEEFLRRYSALIKAGDAPTLSTLVLAAVDEYSHLLGLTTEGIDVPDSLDQESVTYCLNRGEGDNAGPRQMIFEFLNDEKEKARPSFAASLHTLMDVKRNWGLFGEDEGVESFCFQLPVMNVQSEKKGRVRKVLHPDVGLAMLFLDWQIGKLIDFHKEKGLFDSTYWIFFGDHGMVDCKKKMNPSSEEDVQKFERHPDSLEVSFIQWINQRQNLPSGEFIGIDDVDLPQELSMPHKVSSWQSLEVQNVVKEANLWAEKFFDKMQSMVRSQLGQKYWYLSLAKDWLVYPKFDQAKQKYKQKVVDLFVQTYLESKANYKAAERAFKNQFFNQRVRLVYGGGARHNAEIFIPHLNEDAKADWSKRPNLEQILHYKTHPAAKETLLETLMSSPGVSLAYIREQNEQLSAGMPLPTKMDILVMDKEGRSGRISVERDADTLDKSYCYQADGEDPLYHSYRYSKALCGSYHQWHTWDVLSKKTPYHGGVAGVGAYLYSTGTALGDILLMHETDWNFSENSGGHGGIHRDEKLTIGLVSGPDIAPGELTTLLASGERAHPSLLDVAPTALSLLGYSTDVLDEFARSGEFLQYWKTWNAGQKEDILNNLFNDREWNQLGGVIGVKVDWHPLRQEMGQFLDFILQDPSQLPLPDYHQEKIDGAILNVK